MKNQKLIQKSNERVVFRCAVSDARSIDNAHTQQRRDWIHCCCHFRLTWHITDFAIDVVYVVLESTSIRDKLKHYDPFA